MTTAAPPRTASESRPAHRRRHRRVFGWDHFDERLAAVEAARQAAQERQPLSRTRTAQALIDLAFCCEQLAVPMEPPNVRLNARESRPPGELAA